MDTLSTSVSTLQAPTNREFYLFKRTPPYATPNRPPPHTTSIFPKSTNPNFLHKSSSYTSPPLISYSKTNSPLQQQSSPIIFHSKPATGYAAAMIDVAQSTSSLHSVHRDVQRLLRLLFLQSADAVGDEVRGERAMRHVVEKQGSFHRHVVALLKVLLKKKKLGIVQQVLQEFERIYHQLCGGDDDLQLFGVA